jgi:hypothetical protein
MQLAIYLAASAENVSFLSFLKETSSALIIAVGLCLIFGLSFQHFVEYRLRVREMKNWISEHRESLQRLMQLNYHTQVVKEKLPPCPHCNSSNYSFWNFGSRQITFRCNDCSEITRIRAFSNVQVRIILEYLPALLVILPGFYAYQKNSLGKKLAKVCYPIALYCQRHFSRLEARTRG